MSAPLPPNGPNPFTGLYQTSQFDNEVAGGLAPWGTNTVFSHLNAPSSAGVAAAASPSVEFLEATSPTPGANDDETDSDGV